MRCSNIILPLFLLVWLAVNLVACERKPDPTTDPITPETVSGDLHIKAISGLDEKEFKTTGPLLIENFSVDYAERNGVARFTLRAISESGDGIDGEVRARYLFENGWWRLQDFVAEPSAKMESAYARRLTELGDFPLHFAAFLGDLEMVRKELENGADVNAPENKKLSTALIFASERGHLPIVKLLVAQGAKVTNANQFGYTALHASVRGGHAAIAEFLLANGADSNAVDDRGRTPLFAAAESRSLTLTQRLMEHGATLDVRDRKQWTPLYAAVNQGAVDVAEFLIEQGAEVKSQTPGSARSPLLMACYAGNVEMVKLLIEAGADVNARVSMGHSGHAGMTALQIAAQRGHQQVVDLLRNAGASD
ncbi:MAG: hypothetical protein C0614_06135 [Desulfuromonas sp.]|nr:MAG: hypothetical protein C0614_06135 [Desulfuromonas sp.]